MPKGKFAPIEITLYDKESAPVKTYTTTIVPWGLLKSAIRLSKTIDTGNLTEEDADNLAGLVIATFGDQFSLADLDQGADISEMMTVLTAIIARAKGISLNPTPPG